VLKGWDKACVQHTLVSTTHYMMSHTGARTLARLQSAVARSDSGYGIRNKPSWRPSQEPEPSGVWHAPPP